MNRCLLHVLSSLLMVVCCVGCGGDPPEVAPAADATVNYTTGNDVTANTPQPSKLSPEAWASRPQDQWPQIVLTNDAEFKGHTPLRGASSFLIETDDDRVLAATAGHLLGSAGGVEPDLPVNQLSQKLQSWKMHPRTLPDDAVEIAALGAAGLDESSLDWLILSIKKTDPLPAHPLKLRKEPVKVGEKVFLIGCPYSEPDCKQNVYAGTVTERAYGDRFRYDIDPPVDIRGFSGAPIIDAQGHVVGVMTVWFDPKMSGDDFLEAGGEDIATIYDQVQRVK